MPVTIIAPASKPYRIHVDPTHQARLGATPPGEFSEPMRFRVENTTVRTLRVRVRPAFKPKSAAPYMVWEIATNGYPERWQRIDPASPGVLRRIEARGQLLVGIRWLLNVSLEDDVKLTVGIAVEPVGI